MIAETAPITAPKPVVLERKIPMLASFPAVLCGLLVLLVFIAFRGSIADPDLWWHLRNSEYLLTHHTFPFHDIYSFTARGQQWVPHEWLGEMLLYAGFKVAGLRGVFAVSFCLCSLIFLGVFYLSFRESGDVKNSFVVTIVAILLGKVSFGPRTLLLGWLWLVVLLILLQRLRQGKPVKLWALPLLFLVWVNSHGSWFMGLFLLGAVLACGLFDHEWARVDAIAYSRPHIRRLALMLMASFAVLFANPGGYRVLLYPLDVRFKQKVAVQSVAEWASVNFHNARGQLVMVLILTLLVAALFSRQRWRLEHVLFTVLALYMCLSYVRMIFLAGILLPPVLARHCKLMTPYDAEAERPVLNAGVIAASILFIGLMWPTPSYLDQQVKQSFPTEAVAYMAAHGVHGNLLNCYGWGGYLIWNLRDVPVFIDGRADVYDHQGVFAEFATVMGVTNAFPVLDKYKIDYALLESNTPLAYLLSNSPDWTTEYSDKKSKLFRRVPKDRTQTRAELDAIFPTSSGGHSVGLGHGAM